MNDNDAEKIAGAINIVRPGWPTASLLTLMRKNLMHRPRRDVFVALAWIASEASTKTPARVLENGPWWIAAGTDGNTAERRTISPDRQCGECGHAESVCRRLSAGDHDYRPASNGTRGGTKADPELIAQTKAAIAATEGPRMEERRTDRRERCNIGTCTRGAEHTGPHAPAEDGVSAA